MKDLIWQNRKGLLVILILVIGLIIATLLIQRKQIFFSRAGAEGLIITSLNGQPVTFQQTTDQSYYETEADSIQFSAGDIEVLKK